MKLVLIILSITILSAILYFVYLGIKSQNGSAAGLINNQLKRCPDKPNCICTEFIDDSAHYTDAISFKDEAPDTVFNAIERTIVKTGGTIISSKENYLAATYTSQIFRYVDDFEVRVDHKEQTIHMRSASRVGRSDFDANLKRIIRFKNELVTQSLYD